MLFHKVAINPDDVLKEEMLDALKYNFGWYKKRLIVDLPKNCKSSMLQKANTLPDGTTKLRVKSLLNNFDVIDSGIGDYKPNTWISMISQASTLSLYNALISSSDASLPYRYDTSDIDRYLDDSEECIGSFTHKNKSAKELVDLVDPILRVNKRLVLINPDQYLFSGKSKILFEALFLRWQDYGGLEFKVIRSMRDGKFDQAKWDKEGETLRKFLTKNSYKSKFKFIAVDDNSNRIHKRYLFGPTCGIELDYGLEINNMPQTWSILHKPHYLHLKEVFLDKDVLDLYPDHLVHSY